MEPERLILRSLAGKSRGWLVVDSVVLAEISQEA